MTVNSWDVYQRRINQNGSTQKDRLIANSQRTITDKFSNTSELITINGTSQEVQITDENSLFKNPNKKRLLCKPDENINIGDLIVWDSEYWLCTDTDDIEIYVRGIIEKCNNNLKYLSSTGDVVSIPCIITDRILMDVKENKYYILPDNKIWVIVGFNVSLLYYLTLFLGSSLDTIIVDQRFIFGGNAYKVEAIDNITKTGLITFKMCFDDIVQDDNTTLGIANYTSRTHTYSVNILNIDTDITLGNTLQLELECKDNDVVVVNPSVAYSLETGSTGYISVNASGLISTIATGSGNILTTWNSSTDTINIDCVASAVTASYVYSLVGNVQPDNEIKYNQQKVFTANKYYSTGSIVTGSVFDFSVTLSTGASSSNYLLTISSDNTCALKCLQYSNNITLVAICDAIPTS